MYFQCQRFCQGMIILNRHSQHILPDNWSKPLSIYPPQSPSLVVSKKRERNMQFQMYRWLTLKCQCSAKFRGCYRINGNVKVSKTRYAWWWSPRKNLIHIVFTNEPNQPTILIYFCSLKRGSSFRRNLFSVISYYHVAMRWDHRIIPRCVRLWWWWW